MKKSTLFYSVFAAVLLYSCAGNSSENNSSSNDEVEKLKTENKRLKEELENLKSNLSEENIEPLIFKSSMCDKIKSKDSVIFNVMAIYNRPDFIVSAYGKIFNGTDPDQNFSVFDSIQPTEEFLLGEIQVSDGVLDRSIVTTQGGFKKGWNTFAGLLKIKKNGEYIYKPFSSTYFVE
jgi:regulator of replication initiation timing